MEKAFSESYSIVKELLTKLNELRTNPVKVANKLTITMSYINKRDNILREPNKPPVKLNEGIKAYEEAITFLKTLQPLDEFVYEDSLSKIAQDFSKETIKKGSSDTSKFEDRFKKIATYSDLHEILLYSENDPAKIVMNLVVCDGDNKRTNRSLILSPQLKQIGIGFSTTDAIDSLRDVCVIDLSKNWKVRTNLMLGLSNIQENLPLYENNSLLAKDYFIDPKLVNLNQDLIEKYDKELDGDIKFDDFVDKTEHKQIITEGNRVKLIKNIAFTFVDGSTRRIILSKTWKS